MKHAVNWIPQRIRFRSRNTPHTLKLKRRLHPKTLVEIAVVLSTNSGSFPSNKHVFATFSICSDLGDSGIRKIVRNSMLTGRWWEGRILINLCGKNNVRNCNLWQSDFFARCRTVLRRQRDFLACVVTLKKRWGPERLWFLTLEKHATKSHLPKLIVRAGRSNISGPGRVSAQSTAEMKLIGVSSTCHILKFAYIFIRVVGWAAIVYSPAKCCDNASQKQADTAQYLGNTP